MIKAKMKCAAITQRENSQTVELAAISSEDKQSENYSWSRYTPSGTIVMEITNPDAFGAFIPGKEYFIEFTPCVSI